MWWARWERGMGRAQVRILAYHGMVVEKGGTALVGAGRGGDPVRGGE